MRNAIKRFIRLDVYFEKLRVKGSDKAVRQQFGIPEGAFKSIDELKNWEDALFDNKEKLEAWDQMITSTLEEVGLHEKYSSNLEQFFTLNSNGMYDIGQPNLSRSRVEDKYLRNKAIFQLSQAVDPRTGKKIKAKDVAEKFQPNAADTEQHFQSERKLNKWHKEYGLSENKTPGAAVRKIISRHKKNFSS